MRAKIDLVAALGLQLLCLAAQAQPNALGWPAATPQTRPWARWWWVGSAVDAPNIRRELAQFRQAGMGGVEITPIYGAIGYEAQYIDFLTPRWLQMLGTATHAADSLGLGVDMNLGTGWPYGGPQVTPAAAAGKLVVQSINCLRASAWVKK